MSAAPERKEAGLIALPAADLEVSRRFYRDLVALPELAFHPHDDLPAFDFDLGTLRLRIYRWNQPFARGGHSGLLLYTEDLEAARERLLTAGIELTDIRTEPWGGRVFTFADPGGNRLDFVDAAYRDGL